MQRAVVWFVERVVELKYRRIAPFLRRRDAVRMDRIAQSGGQAHGGVGQIEERACDLIGRDDSQIVFQRDAQSHGRRMHEQMVQYLAFDRAARLFVRTPQKAEIPVAIHREQHGDERPGDGQQNRHLDALRHKFGHERKRDDDMPDAERQHVEPCAPAVAGHPMEHARLRSFEPRVDVSQFGRVVAREHVMFGIHDRYLRVERRRRGGAQRRVQRDACEHETVRRAVPCDHHEHDDSRRRESDRRRREEPHDTPGARRVEGRDAARAHEDLRQLGQRRESLARRHLVIRAREEPEAIRSRTFEVRVLQNRRRTLLGDRLMRDLARRGERLVIRARWIGLAWRLAGTFRHAHIGRRGAYFEQQASRRQHVVPAEYAHIDAPHCRLRVLALGLQGRGQQEESGGHRAA
ncbi:hypothetical protein [Caballeronia sp. SL2Y3]|uniref:hypothetical protein n=1 Tax=Caballeronia sp. SL2Y3 TaxID=2878151 RepID=UPI001FCFD529|nr:hypothetical protein [Caballeronia sp. SL2Y3]